MSAEIDEVKVSELRSFMKEKKVKKSPSKADAEEFEFRWLELVAQSGLVDETFALLCEGFSFCAAKPLFDCCRKPDFRSFSYRTLGSFSTMRENANEIELRVYMSLFAFELIDSSKSDQIGFLIKKIPSAALNKEQKISGNAFKYAKKLIVSELAGKTIKTNPDGISLSTKEASRFVKFLVPLVREVSDNPKAKASERDAAVALLEWLGKLCEPETQQVETFQKKANNDEEDVGSTVSPDNVQQLQTKCLTANQIVAAVCYMDKKIESLKSAVASADSEITRLRTQRDDFKDTVATTQEHLDKSRSVVALQSKEIDELKAKIESLQGELDSNKQLIELLDQASTKRSDETIKRIARKLKIEYQDYQDALGLDMDADLGENMRLQLGSVFQTLIENGFEL